jgi:hypothetical protein
MRLAIGLALGASALRAQPAPRALRDEPLPFQVGETLVYQANLGRMKGRGRAEMRVMGPEELRGRSTYRLEFDLQGRVAGLGVEDHTRSWLDPVTVGALRFTKRERSPLSSITEAVDLYADRREWVTARDSGTLVTEAPLDELSFIYFVRTLPLRDGEEYVFERHYDATRNPTRVRVVARERVTVPLGEFPAIVVEMRVQDPRRYDGEGVIRIHLTDDARRIPLRIASRMRRAGSTVLSLESIAEGSFAAH